MTSLPIFTELEAVNGMLLLVGEQPVASLDDTPVSAAGIARQMLRNETVDLLNKGWHFNTFLQSLIPDASHNIVLPANTIRARLTDATRVVSIVGNKLYDNDNETFEFLSSSYEVELVKYFPFDDLPVQAKRYLEIVTGRKFIKRVAQGRDTIALTLDEEISAKVELDRFEQKNTRRTIFDSYRPASILNKWSNPSGGNTRS